MFRIFKKKYTEKEFTEKELISFGNYLLSEERKSGFEAGKSVNDVPKAERLAHVHDCDLENWKSLFFHII